MSLGVELAEIRDFLAAHAPFDSLPAGVLDRLPARLDGSRSCARSTCSTSCSPAAAGSRRPGGLRLWSARARHGLPRVPAHDALGDALACAEL